MTVCPVAACETRLQPIRGSIVDGVAAHLAMVHGMTGPAARAYAEEHLDK